VASKNRRSGRGKGPRQGISGNPQRRAEQLAQRRPATADEPGLNGDFAARSRAAALTEAVALVDEEANDPAAERDEGPFRRQE
jgi:hypothetical protein